MSQASQHADAQQSSEQPAEGARGDKRAPDTEGASTEQPAEGGDDTAPRNPGSPEG